jgi:cytoskeleton protein RodZ
MTKVTQLTLDERGALNRKRIHLREISGDADSPLETVGQDLRAARLRRGDDLATVSRTLKIRKDHLEALEEDRLEALPGRTYAVGFVRSYADYLGLDPVQCVERFKGEIAGRQETPAPVAYAPDATESRLPHGWVVIAVVLLGLVIWGAYHLAISADSLLRQPVAPLPARMAPPVTAQVNNPKPPPVASTQPATAPATANTAQTPPVNALAAPGTAPSPQAGLATAPGTAPAQTPSTPAAPPPQGQAYGLQNSDARVVLRVTAPTKIVVVGPDGKPFINRVLQPGDSYNVPNRPGFTLMTTNGGAVGLELDGQAMGTAGSANQVVEKMSLDPQAVFDKFNGGGAN